MWRLYNPYTGEHFYTASEQERNALVSTGWRGEGVGWVAPLSSGTPVYRLYNRFAPGGDHHYTTSTDEVVALVEAGWRHEGIGWYSDDARTVAVLRQYNPYASSGSHNYTSSPDEASSLVQVGWRDEGIGWYACAAGDRTTTTGSGVTVSGPEGFTETPAFREVERQIAAVLADGRDIGVVMVDLQSGRGIQYNADEPLYSASSVKALYCAMIYELYGGAGGSRALVEDAVVNSSNDAYSALVLTYGRVPFRMWLVSCGATGATFPGTSIYPFISAGDMGRAWEHVWRWSVSGGPGAPELSGFLSRTRHSAMGSLLRKRYQTWAKPGWYPTDGRYTSTNDTGVVFSDCGPYVLVVMTSYPEDFTPLFAVVDALNVAHGELCGGSTESLLGGCASLS